MSMQSAAVKALLSWVVWVVPPLVSQTPTDSKQPEAVSQRGSPTTPTQVTEPRPDYGVVDGQHYVNGYFGFSYRYPEGWKGNAIQFSNSGVSSMYMLFTANPATTVGADIRYLSVNVDSLPKGATTKDFLAATVKRVAGPTGAFDVLHPDKQPTFGGKEFHRVDLVSKSAPGNPAIYQTLVFTLFPNCAISFSFVATDPSGIEDLVRSMESLSFTALDHSATRAVREAKAGPQRQPK